MAERAVLSPESAPLRLARIDLDQYHRMLEAGILRDGDPIELLDGLLVLKDRSTRGEDPMSVGKRHMMCVSLLAGLDALLRPHRCYLRSQGPISLPPMHEPEPDGAVVRGNPRDYSESHPGPGDVYCVFEVSDSSLAQDRTRKAALYAGAGIPQYVIVNLIDDRIEVFTQPRMRQGKYAQVVHLKAGASLALNCGAGKRVQVPVRDLLP